MKDTSVLIMSCDSFEDCWNPFFKLKEKYWSDCPFKTYICTETKECQYATTIKKTDYIEITKESVIKYNPSLIESTKR